MIIDVVKSKGIAYRCDNCKTCFVWKPEGQGICTLLAKGPKCGKPECDYYRPVWKKCPECGSDDLTEIPAIVYKIMRAVK